MNKSAFLGAESTLLRLFLDQPNELRHLSLAEPDLKTFLKKLGSSSRLHLEQHTEEAPSYSGYEPRLWFVGTPSEGALNYSLWLMARSLYLSADRSDLSAWLNDSLCFSYSTLSKVSYIKSRNNFDFVVQSESAMVAGLYPKV